MEQVSDLPDRDRRNTPVVRQSDRRSRDQKQVSESEDSPRHGERRARSRDSRKRERNPSRKRDLERRSRSPRRGSRGVSTGSRRHTSYGKVTTARRSKRVVNALDDSPSLHRSRRRRNSRGEGSNSPGAAGGSRRMAYRGRSRAGSSLQQLGRRPRPRDDKPLSEDRRQLESLDRASAGGVRLVEAEDRVSQDDERTRNRTLGEERDRRPGLLDEVQLRARAVLTKGCSYGSVGSHLTELMLSMPSPMGDFMRQYCSTQPPPAVRPYFDGRGDVLPTHPGAITTALDGIDPGTAWTDRVGFRRLRL